MMGPDCDNCTAIGKESKVSVVLADGMPLCADCAEELRDLYESL
jgi:hypothetical protein